MTVGPILTVARRELRDTVTDWRMMLPVLILTFVVPALVQTGLLAGWLFVDTRQTVARAVPFALLLCGFMPASFSLVSALESFVGEKERNTLESLLAMPLSDGELYLGKLTAALLLPLMSSLLAMTTLAGLLVLRAPPELLATITPLLGLLIVALVSCKALIMVAGAVIISAHTTTTRAANLLASLVLIPMATIVQLEAILVLAGQPLVLGLLLAALAIAAFLLLQVGMGTFNREAILGREHTGFSWGRVGWTFGRFWSAYLPPEVAPERYTGRFHLGRFYRRDLPMLLREYRTALALATVGALVGLVLGLELFGVVRLRWLDRAIRDLGRPQSAGLLAALSLFAVNARLSFLANLVAPVSFGVAAMLVPFFAFARIGYMLAWASTHGHGTWSFLIRYVLPQGMIELPVLILAAALGLRTGTAIFRAPPGVSVGQNLLWAFANTIKVWLFVIVPLLLLAALIQAVVVPGLTP